MTDEERVGLDETRRLIYMAAFDKDDASINGTIINALLHHHPDLLDGVDREAVENWLGGGMIPAAALMRAAREITARLEA